MSEFQRALEQINRAHRMAKHPERFPIVERRFIPKPRPDFARGTTVWGIIIGGDA